MNTPAKAAYLRLFLSYQHGGPTSPQEYLIEQLRKALEGRYTVLSDKNIPPGEHWGEWIEKQIAESDIFVALLSFEAMWSEMVIDEIARAHRGHRTMGKPRIIPVRIRNDHQFPYPLSAYLNLIQWFNWRESTDTASLIEHLQILLPDQSLVVNYESNSGHASEMPPAPIAPLEAPFGGLHPDSKYYVRRDSDDIMEETLEKLSVTLNVKGSRQTGKTSLLAQLKRVARNNHRKVVSIDFQLFDDVTIQRADMFYPTFFLAVTDALGLVNTFEHHQHKLRTLPATATRYMEADLLPAVQSRITLVMDEGR
jgi:hypothetical protein